MRSILAAGLAVLWGGAALAESKTDLHYCAQEGDRACVEKELRRGFAVDELSDTGITALFYAAANGRDRCGAAPRRA
jgi:ankyrin repeat protein